MNLMYFPVVKNKSVMSEALQLCHATSYIVYIKYLSMGTLTPPPEIIKMLIKL